MQSQRDILINKAITHPNELPPLLSLHGLILRYDIKVWRAGIWQAHIKTHSSNALLLSQLEKEAKILFRSQDGIHALYQTKETAINAACTANTIISQKGIPMSSVLYTGEGLLDNNTWLCNIQYLAESLLTLGAPSRMLLHKSFTQSLTPPEGIGFFPATRAEERLHQQEFFYLKDYRSYDDTSN